MFYRNSIGHGDLWRMVSRELPETRVLVFSGPEGVGKGLFARDVARLLRCDVYGCGECDVCKGIDDVDAYYYSSEFSIEDARALSMDLLKKPLKYRNQVFILDNVKFSIGSMNALLKSLEEIPEHSWVLYIRKDGIDGDEILLSRGIQYIFNKLTVDEVNEILGGEEYPASHLCRRTGSMKFLNIPIQILTETYENVRRFVQNIKTIDAMSSYIFSKDASNNNIPMLDILDVLLQDELDNEHSLWSPSALSQAFSNLATSRERISVGCAKDIVYFSTFMLLKKTWAENI